MTGRHRFIVWGWIAVVVAAGVYAPWTSRGYPEGYYLVFAPPKGRGPIHVDQSRLILEWIIATVIAAGFYFAPLTVTRPRFSINFGQRLGFQRLYAVLATTWITTTSFLILFGGWEPWLRFQEQPQTAQVDYDAIARKLGFGDLDVT